MRSARKALLCLLALSTASLAAPRPPRLVVLVIVDQLSASAFQPILARSTGGFRRLASEGFRVNELLYEAAPSQTAPGHATLGTGAYPELHGIVSNEWYDVAEGKAAYVCTDPSYRSLGREVVEGDATSPLRMRTGTLGDAFKATSGSARVVGIAGKDRGALLLVGRAANVALWIDYQRPAFTSSTLYSAALPAWVEKTNQRIAAELAAGYRWDSPHPQNPPPERPFARDSSGFGKAFPHLIRKDLPPKDLSALVLLSPLGDDAVAELSIAALTEVKLGADEIPDLLTVSFSGYDRVLHIFGPDSPEAQDAIARIDANVAKLLAALDAKVGKGKYTVALASDHGGTPVPEVLQQAKLDAGRVDTKALVAALEVEASKLLGGKEHFAGFYAAGVYAQPASRVKLEASFERLREVARAQPGVLDLYSKAQLLEGKGGPLAAMYRRGLDRERSPDFFVLPKAYWTYGTKDVTAHGSQHRYDRAVPLILYGAGIRKGEAAAADFTDLAPTLSFLAGTEPPSDAQGRVLLEALAR